MSLDKTMSPHRSPSEAAVLVAGIARNCGANLRAEVARITDALTDFKKVFWLVVESDSQDDTLATLEQLSRKFENFSHISLGSLIHEYPLRTDRIAQCRNRYLTELESNPLYAELDYVIIADLDGVNSLLDRPGLLSCFTRTDWDVCTANQRGPYYDVWALRHPIWCPSDCWEQVLFLSEFNPVPEDVHHIAVYSKMLEIPEDRPWIEVQSAFGGLGIYRAESIKSCRYVGIRQDGEQVCEHVSFHSSIIDRGGRIFINPRLINSGINEHTIPVLKRAKLSFYALLLYRQCKRHAKGWIKRTLIMLGIKFQKRVI